MPGIGICYYIFRVDKYERETWWHLILCFFLGMAATWPAIVVETQIIDMGYNEYGGLLDTLLYSLFGIALVEESVKLIALFIFPYFFRFFNEPMDGIVYMVMIGMGFATLENVIYSFNNGFETALIRAFTAVPAHALFAVIAGYYIGLAKFDAKNRIKYLFGALGLAVLVHGIYDFFLLQELYDWLSAFAILTLFISYQFAKKMIQSHWINSPFNKLAIENKEPEIDWNLTETTDTEIQDLLNEYDKENEE